MGVGAVNFRESNCSAREGLREIPAQPIHRFRRADPIQQKWIVALADQTAVGGHGSLVTRSSALLGGLLCPAWEQRRARVRKVFDGRIQLPFYPLLRLRQFVTYVLEAEMRHVWVSHGMGAHNVSMLNQAPDLIPRHDQLARILGQLRIQFLFHAGEVALQRRPRQLAKLVTDSQVDLFTILSGLKTPHFSAFIRPACSLGRAKTETHPARPGQSPVFDAVYRDIEGRRDAEAVQDRHRRPETVGAERDLSDGARSPAIPFAPERLAGSGRSLRASPPPDRDPPVPSGT